VGQNQILTEALAFAARGHAVFPLHGISERASGYGCTCGVYTCDRKGKHPYGSLAQNGFHSATTDPAAIQAWPAGLNYAVHTKGLVVIDVDPRSAGDDSLRALEREHGTLPVTWKVQTGGGGEHYYYSRPDGAHVGNKLAQGVELKSDNGYAVGPGSWHESGRHYVWDVDGHPDEVPLAPLPAWVLTTAVGAPVVNGHRGAKPIEHYVEIAKGGLPDGERNNLLCEFAGHLLRGLVDPEVVRYTLWGWNLGLSQTPLSWAEFTSKFDGILAKELRRREQ
jgi:hypothetical protein